LRLDPGTTKNRDGRIVYLVPEVKDALTGQLMRVRTLERSLGKIIPFVFPSPRNRLKAGPWTNIKNAWWGACRRAGCPQMLQHDLRRTAVRNMLDRGLSERVAMSITGHRTRSMVDRYPIVAPADLQDAAKRMAHTSLAQTRAHLEGREPRGAGNVLI